VSFQYAINITDLCPLKTEFFVEFVRRFVSLVQLSLNIATELPDLVAHTDQSSNDVHFLFLQRLISQPNPLFLAQTAHLERIFTIFVIFKANFAILCFGLWRLFTNNCES
jgi:hypothetical protein